MTKPSCHSSDSTAYATDILLRLGKGLLASDTALAIFTPDDRLYFATPDFMTLYDIQPGPQGFDSIIRHCYRQDIGPRIETTDIDAWLGEANAKRRSESVRKFEIDMIDGRWMWATETTFADQWIWLAVDDFTAVKRRESSLRIARDAAITASETDDLTGLFNRGATMRRFGDLIGQASSEGSTFSAVLIDLDHFKTINDRFGHDGGDQVLVHFAACVREVLRERDILGRVGGEEFLLIMPDATFRQASGVLERLQAHLRDQRMLLGETTVRYTFSAGIAEWAESKTLENLYRDADQALYAAKAGGRDQVRRAAL